MLVRTPFSKRLELYRRRLGLSMKDIAKRVGVPESTYRDWEYGSEMRGEKYYERLARALEVSIEELLTGEQRTKKIEKGIALIQEGLALLKSS